MTNNSVFLFIKRNKYFLILTTIFILLLSIQSAMASRILYVAPQRVVIESNKNTSTVNIMNQSDKKRAYNISLIDSVMLENGTTKRVDTFEYSTKRMLRYVPRSVVLEPGERQVVRVMVRRPKDLPDGDYHSHILFREDTLKSENTNKEGTDLSFEVGAQYGLAIPVIVQHGKIESSMSIAGINKEASTLKNIVVTFSRTGNAESASYLRVFKIISGEKKEISPAFWVRMYREVNEVTRSVPVLKDMEAKGELIFELYKNSSQDAKVIQRLDVTL